MAVQQRRNSKTRTAKRRTHYKLVAPKLEKCPACGAWKQPHHACPQCGYTGADASAAKENA
ncbi:MAG: 50S ribosomal protein L32 [Galactobacillus timonensis]|uniref:50S ribosomal protein L32 n=1 Tax=Galactobacillus timonensis TaxID=2041840 RepID=UPI000C819B63|nr:50S ribosomal protein L32 [Galactobacillus timonensis]MDY5223401.1 50S ribosomal protein L32 [Lachnospiraceae bacterium]MDY6281618.1 50S ribosomal protein L32 [Erysipelotrichaceae bacterium]MCI6068506.1 50S ribosomal protein L32 [Galactobacillus timonensis]MCI6755187.1 50S ribosomal protein L32 [Galactobacillus timonensis]MDD5851347.1 50S ribosomal protein L32 [Galactobacillus timonensis]